MGERNAQKEILKKRGDRGRRPLGYYGSETPKVFPALLGLEDVVDEHCDSSSLDELKDAPVIACA